MKSLSVLPIAATLGSRSSAANPKPPNSLYGHKFKLSLNTYSFNKLLLEGQIDLFDLLQFCAKHNFDAIDPTGYYFPGYPELPPDTFINEFKRKAFLLGLDISGTGVRNDFSVADPDKRRAEIEHVKSWVKVAAKLGSPNLRIFAGKTEHQGFSRDQVFDWMAKDIRECCKFAQEHGVLIALQNHAEFLKTADDVDRLFKRVDSPWLGLNLDVGSYHQKDPYEEIRQNIGHAITWQIKENVRVDGEKIPTDLEKLFGIIKKSGYRGYLPLETLGEGDPFVKVPLLLQRVRDALAVAETSSREV
ncbi:sugar phosphate isomerase/epimerase family protein [Planctomycetota bacterium]